MERGDFGDVFYGFLVFVYDIDFDIYILNIEELYISFYNFFFDFMRGYVYFCVGRVFLSWFYRFIRSSLYTDLFIFLVRFLRMDI